MFALVNKDFNDKYTGKFHKAGEVIEVTKERFEELINAGNFVVKAKSQKIETAEDKQETVDEEAEKVEENVEE